MEWRISEMQKKLLDVLFEKVEGQVSKILDMGTGRTSLQYLTDRYPDIKVEAVVYPGDERKLQPIRECVKNTNYRLIETDLKDFDFNQEFDVALAHLFLGEAEKFAENKFEEILDGLFQIKTKYLVLVNLFRDNINYNLLLKKIADTGNIVKVAYIKSENGDDCLGLTIQFK